MTDEPTVQRPPRDDLYRGSKPGVELREAGVEGAKSPTLVGHFARFGVWNLIDSVVEGRFLELVKPGAYAQTLATKGSGIRVMLEHGKGTLGNTPIAVPTVMREDATGPYFEAELLDGVPPLVLDGIRRGAYGISYRFRVVKEDWQPNPRRGPHNPEGLPERMIQEAEVYEFGPVVWAADPGADVAMRSLTDAYILDRFTSEPARLAEIIDAMPADPALPAEAEAEPHPEPESREPDPPIDVPDPPPVEAAPEPDPAPAGSLDSKEPDTMEYISRDEKVARINELKAELTRKAVEYPGVLPADVQTAWDADDAEVVALERDVAAWDARQARVLALAENAENTRSAVYSTPNIVKTKSVTEIYDIVSMRSASRTEEDFGQALRDNSMRSVETAIFPHPKSAPDEFRTAIATLLDEKDTPDKELARRILVTGSPVYKRAFAKAVRGESLSPEESRAAALAVTGTTTTGGWMVPYVFDPTIIPIGAHTSINPFRSACRVETIVGGNKWVGVSATNVAAIYETESVAATEAGPTIGEPTMTVQRASAFVSLSRETLQDRPDIASELSVLIQEGKDTLEEAQYAGGTGATVYPFGMFYVGAFHPEDTAAQDTVALGDLYIVEAALPLRYQLDAAWFMSRATLRKFQAFETGGGQLFGGVNYAHTPYPNASPIGNTGVTLLGRPVWEVPSAVHAAADFTTSLRLIAAYGDPRRYVIVDRAGMSVEMIPNLFDGAGKPTGQRGLFAFWRNTARPIIDGTDGMIAMRVHD